MRLNINRCEGISGTPLNLSFSRREKGPISLSWELPKNLAAKESHERAHKSLTSQASRCGKAFVVHLRDRQLAGCQFRRQHMMDGYIVDFICLEPELIVELDGGQQRS